MRCIYINLDSATRRRAAIEASFAACAPEGWSLERFEAVRAAEVSTPGAISPAEKACFLSHRDALATVLEDDEPVFMLEDDVVFSRFTARVVSDALDHPDWDLLFTDVAVTNEGSMARLARLRRELVEASRCDFLDLSDISFAGSAAYVVSGQAKRRLWEILCSAPALDGPYDLVLRELLRHRMITAPCSVPLRHLDLGGS